MLAQRTRWILLAWLFSIAASPGALAQLYKWVDENGVVNYGDKPPKNKPAQAIDQGAGSVSVVPGPPPDEIERQRARDAERRVQRLEREVDELRARQATREVAPAPEPVYRETYVPGTVYPPPSRRYDRAAPRHRAAPYEPKESIHFEPPRSPPARSSPSAR